MFGYCLQDWITIRGGAAVSGTNDIIQGESGWMGFSSFQDIVLWLDVREATFPAGGGLSITWSFETSPTKDDALFKSMGSVTLTSSFTPGVQALTKVITGAASPPAVPLATWVRWRLIPNGASGANTWDATFRVLAAANRVVSGLALA